MKSELGTGGWNKNGDGERRLGWGQGRRQEVTEDKGREI